MLMAADNKALTIGHIAARCGVPIHRVEYVVKTRDIRPACRAGLARIFDESAADRIESEIRRIEAGRSAGGAL